MREFLLSKAPLIIWAVIAVEIILLILLFKQFGKHKNAVSLLAAFVDLGLIYDALIIALGKILPDNLLVTLSQYRFVFHGLLVPLLLPISAMSAGMKTPLKILVWIITLAIMAGGVWMGLNCKLELKELAGLTRYVSSNESLVLVKIIENALSFGTVIPLMIAGVFTLIRKKNIHILLSGLFMFAFSALGPATGNTDLIFLISMFGEVLMILFMYFYVATEARRGE